MPVIDQLTIRISDSWLPVSLEIVSKSKHTRLRGTVASGPDPAVDATPLEYGSCFSASSGEDERSLSDMMRGTASSGKLVEFAKPKSGGGGINTINYPQQIAIAVCTS